MPSLQQQFPLSPKKFTKKMLNNAIPGAVFWALVSGFFIWLGAAMFTDSQNSLPLPGINALFVWLLCIVVFIGCLAAYWKAYIRSYYYAADDHFITIRKGVFAPAEIHVQFAKIQDVYVDQDIIDRIMGLYDVHIASATVTSGIEAHIDGVEKAAAEGLKDLFLGRIRSGSVSPPAPIQSNASIVSANSVSPAVVTGDISTRTYPILFQWLVPSLVTYFFSSLIYTFFAWIYVLAPGKNGEPSWASMFGATPESSGTVLMMVFAVLYLVHVIWLVLWRNSYFFEFLPEYIVLRDGVISREEKHLPYRTIQNVTVSQSITERIFGLASVTIENAAQGIMIGKQVASSGSVVIPGQTLALAKSLAEAARSVSLGKDSSQTGL